MDRLLKMNINSVFTIIRYYFFVTNFHISITSLRSSPLWKYSTRLEKVVKHFLKVFNHILPNTLS